MSVTLYITLILLSSSVILTSNDLESLSQNYITVKWDASEYPLDSKGTAYSNLQVTAPSMNTKKNQAEIIQILITSTSDPKGTLPYLLETGTNTGIFYAPYNILFNPTGCCGSNILKVNYGDTVTAEFEGIKGITKIAKAPDKDGDGIPDSSDNCIDKPNKDQLDTDKDGIGDVCDTTPYPDSDGDGIYDNVDQCLNLPENYNGFEDTDGCPDDPYKDNDNDGIYDQNDLCDEEKENYNGFEDTDGCPDVAPDKDGDGIPDSSDNCIDKPNKDQLDTDKDGIGDVCDTTPRGPDSDKDGIADMDDNCKDTPNKDQLDTDKDGIGDVCDDNSITVTTDMTHYGDADTIIVTGQAQNYTYDANIVIEYISPSGFVFHIEQASAPKDSFSAALPIHNFLDDFSQTGTFTVIAAYKNATAKTTFYFEVSDSDDDGIRDAKDNCPNTSNLNQKDSDLDGLGDVCDDTPFPPPSDSDKDGITDEKDNCPKISNKGQLDTDKDGIGDVCDTTPRGPDSDKDGIADMDDNCKDIPNKDQLDTDKDGIGDVCDSISYPDSDGDGIPDSSDSCPHDQHNDSDGDGICGDIDSCPSEYGSQSNGCPETVDDQNVSVSNEIGSGFVRTNEARYKIESYSSVPVNIDGSIDIYKRGIPIILEITKPDGKKETLGITATKLGSFSTMYDLNRNKPGNYTIELFYDGSLINSTSFVAISTLLDSDGDGIPDSSDVCIDEPERFNDFLDEDGCPDLNSILQDGVIIDDLTGVDKPDKTPDKIDTPIYGLLTADNPKDFAQKNNLLYENGITKVQLSISDSSNSLIDRISNLGIIDYASDDKIQLNISVNRLSELEKINEITLIRTPPLVVQHQSLMSEGVEFLNAHKVQSFGGLSGKNVRVGVLDLAFDTSNEEIQKNISESKSFRKDYSANLLPVLGYGSEYVHGTAVAEIITDVAPDVSLHLYTFQTELEFDNALDYAKDNVDMLVMSAGWMNYPTDGTSSMTKKVEEVISSGIPFVVSAGNYAQTHWEDSAKDVDSDGWLEFSLNDEGMSIDISEERYEFFAPITLILLWNDHSVDFDMVLLDSSGEELMHSSNVSNETNPPFEYISYYPDSAGLYTVGISYIGDITNTSLEIFSQNDKLEHVIVQGSVSVPTDARGVISVGALNYQNKSLEPFSSQGPTNIGTLAPVVMGPDAVSTKSYGVNPFFGTSAAAPHVGGMVALLLESSDATPEQTLELIKKNTDRETVSLGKSVLYNNTFGYGKANAEFLLNYTLPSTIEYPQTSPEKIIDDRGSVTQQNISNPPDGGGCLIATATFGTELAPQVQFLREVRDKYVMNTVSGSYFMIGFNHMYYSFSPTLADFERENPVFQQAVRSFITPMITTLSIMTLVENNSEAEVIGLGLYVIVLNLGMYIGLPVVIGLVIHRRLKI